MAVGKYSPTVQAAYMADQSWWDKLPKSDPVGLYDEDGYDSYGYDKNDVDRAGNNEFDYICGEDIAGEWVHVRYEMTLNEWGFKDGKPFSAHMI
jgi:hypothetical protein